MSLPAVPLPREIAEVETPEAAKALYDTLEAYSRHYQHDHEKQNKIAEAKLRTARKGGELLAATMGSGRHKQKSHDETFGRLPEGFTRSMSSRWQMLASIPEDRWEEAIARVKMTANDELTLDRLVRIGREWKLGGRSEKREKRARAEAKEHAPSCKLVVKDIRDWRPKGVRAIVTDPEYIGDALPLYEALRDFAVDVLPEGGALVVMTWQGILPGVVRALEHPDLAYRWCLSWRYAQADHSTVDYARRVFDRWKPILVYHKGAMPEDATMISDEITSEFPDKQHHDWGQSLEGFQHLVRAVAQPGELVCDPFVGGGTTALAALSQGRPFIGADLDREAIRVTKERLA